MTARGGYNTYVVSPTLGNTFYKDLARRIYAALAETVPATSLVDSHDLERDLRQARLVIVNPIECALGNSSFVRLANGAGLRIAALAECVGTKWYCDQFKMGLRLDAVFDFGFTHETI